MIAVSKAISVIAQPLTFDSIPALMQSMHLAFNNLCTEVQQLRKQQPVNEPPIDSNELMVRLAISEPTVIRMRKRGDIPFLEVGGNYRYLWPDVLLALASKKKGAKVLTTKNAQ